MLLAFWLILWAFGKVQVPDPLRKAWPVFVLLGLFLVLQAFQLAPLPPSWVESLSPHSAQLQASSEFLTGPRETMTLSVEPHATQVALLKSLGYTAIFFLVLALVNNRARVLNAARILVYVAVVHSVYAVLMHLSSISDEHFGTMINHGGDASGTFANRNHFAGYLEMISAIGIGLLIAGLSDKRAESWKAFFRELVAWVLSPKMVLRLSLCILVIALTTTHSRMGNTAFFSSLMIAGVLGILLSRRATRNTVLLLTSLVILDLVIVGSWFGVEKLARRLEATTVEDVREREDPAAYSIALIKEYPVFGAGAGTFYVAFPKYRPEKVVAFFDHAHNDYAQIASENGILGLALLGGVVLLSLIASLRGQWVRSDPLMRGMAFASTMGITALLIHSWVDFNLQIPANAALFMVILALGWISLHLDRAHA